MHWIIQSNLYSETTLSDLDRQLKALAHIGATYQCVKLVPFFGVFDPEPSVPAGSIIALGSTTMIIEAKKRGWRPGIFYNDNFSFAKWRDGFGAENLLNGDAKVALFADVDISEDVFIRPCEDLKAFTGFVIDAQHWRNWKQRVLDGEGNTSFAQVNADTMIAVSAPKMINREYRTFIVNQRVITASLYRAMGSLKLDANVDDAIYVFAQSMADKWNPVEAYALDIAESEDGLKVLEINCFNGSGTYACDLIKLYGAIESLIF